MSLKTTVSRNLTGKKVLTFFILSSVVYFTMIFFTIPKLTVFANGLQIFDMKPNGYSFTYAKELLGNLGKIGRNFYLFRQLPLDFVYPFLFMVSNILILSFFLEKIGKLESWFLLVLFPIIAGIFDYLENFGFIYLLTSFPKISEIGVRIISTFTVIKSLFQHFAKNLKLQSFQNQGIALFFLYFSQVRGLSRTLK